MSTAEELARLAQLRDQGVLSEDEFQTQKAAVLRGDRPATPAADAPAPGKKTMGKGCLIVAAILVGLVILFAIVGGTSETATPAADEKAAAARPPRAVTARELFAAYQANEAAAQQEYGDQPLLVTGTVNGVDLDFSNEPVVQLQTSNEFMQASAHLTDASKPKASSLRKGQSARLLCQSVSEVMSMPQLQDCDIQ